jgi:hypothetical protein
MQRKHLLQSRRRPGRGRSINRREKETGKRSPAPPPIKIANRVLVQPRSVYWQQARSKMAGGKAPPASPTKKFPCGQKSPTAATRTIVRKTTDRMEWMPAGRNTPGRNSAEWFAFLPRTANFVKEHRLCRGRVVKHSPAKRGTKRLRFPSWPFSCPAVAGMNPLGRTAS